MLETFQYTGISLSTKDLPIECPTADKTIWVSFGIKQTRDCPREWILLPSLRLELSAIDMRILMCTFDHYYRLTSRIIGFFLIDHCLFAYSQVPNANCSVPPACREQVVVAWVPCNTLDSTCVPRQNMRCVLCFYTCNTGRTISRACCQKFVKRIPLDIKNAIVMRLESGPLGF